MGPILLVPLHQKIVMVRGGGEKDFKFPILRQIIYPTRLSKQRLSGTDKHRMRKQFRLFSETLNMNINAPRPVVFDWKSVYYGFLPASENIIKYKTSSLVKLNNLAQNNNN